jgi:hypothetical protein
MANAAALISLAAAYEKRFGRASLIALGELARQYDPAGAGPGANAQRCAAPIIAHLLVRIASLKREVAAIVAPPPALPATECSEAAGAQAPAEAGDPSTRLQIERGQMPLSDWLRQKARKDMLAMSEQALREHLADLEWIATGPWSAVAGAALPERLAQESGVDHRQLMNEVAAALHIGWLLQEGFAGAGSHADTESALLARMTPYEREQYEVRKENARRRQDVRRKKPEIFSLDAARRRAMLTSRQGRPTN